MKQVHLVNYVPHNCEVTSAGNAPAEDGLPVRGGLGGTLLPAERARQAKCSEFSGILGLDFFRPKSDYVWRTGVTTNETPIRRQ
jgi:hypothetical protein